MFPIEENLPYNTHIHTHTHYSALIKYTHKHHPTHTRTHEKEGHVITIEHNFVCVCEMSVYVCVCRHTVCFDPKGYVPQNIYIRST